MNKWGWEKWTGTCRRMKLDRFLTPHKNKFKMDEIPNMKQEAIKVIEKNIQAATSIKVIENIGSNLLASARATSYWTHLQRQGKQKQQ